MKKFFAFLLIAVMLFCNASTAFASTGGSGIVNPVSLPENNDQQIEYYGGWNPSGYPETGELYLDKIAVRKTIAPTAVENYFDITLEVVAKQQYADQSVDVIMVMDISNTMNATHEGLTPGDTNYNVEDSRLHEAKNAVNAFIDRFASSKEISTDRRFSLVTFNSYADLVIPMTTVDDSTAQSLKASINDITAPTENRVRFTNIEGGLQLAYNVMKTSSAKYKYIIFVTDGFPTTYIESGRDSLTQIVGYDTYMSNYSSTTYDSALVGTDGYFADSVTGKLSLYGTSYSDKAAIKAGAVAKEIKDSGINIFSIGIDVGVQSVPDYVNRTANSSFTVVDRTSDSYAIGSTTESYKHWLSTTIAGGPLLEKDKFEEHRYAHGNDETSLHNAFANILNDIKLAPSYNLRDAYTLDPMSEHVEFLSFYGYDGNYADTITNGANTVATFDPEAETIEWNLLGSVFEYNAERDTYSAKITYRVRVKNELEGFIPSVALLTNDPTTFFFKTVDEDGNILYGDNKIEYPVPQVEAYLGTLEFTKRDSESGEALTGAEFVLTHNGASCHYCEGGVVIPDLSASTDENGVVKFVNIPSGHEYMLTETVAPDGYVIGASHAVTVSYGVTYLHGDEVNENHPAVVYNTKITPVSASVAIEKHLDGRDIENGEFSFVFEGIGQGGARFRERIFVSADGKAEFTPLTFDMTGEYTFYVYEENGGDDTIVYDKTVYEIRYIVTEDNPDDPRSFVLETYVDGIKAKGSDVTVSFENSLRTPVSAILEAAKTMDGNTPESEFVFALTDSYGNVIQTVNNNGGRIVFDAIEYSGSGIYNYTITELHGESSDIVYDHKVYDVTVTVTADENGNSFKASVEYFLDGKAVNTAAFENKTRKEASLIVNAIKTMDGKAPEAGEFTFELRDSENNVIDTATNGENGIIVFDALTFDEIGWHHFTINEVKGDDVKVVYDDIVYYLDVNVGFSHYGESYLLEATLKLITDDGESEISRVSGSDIVINTDGNVVFENTTREFDDITVEIDINKTVDNNGDKEIGKDGFEFILSENGDSIAEAVSDENGKAKFELTFSADDIGKTFTYTVSEKNTGLENVTYDETVYTYVIAIDVDESYNLVATVTKDGNTESLTAEFTNVYTYYNPDDISVVIDVNKTVNNSGNKEIGADGFEFVLSENGNVITEVISDENGKAKLELTFTYEDIGKTFTYTVNEKNTGISGVTYDETVYTYVISIDVDDNNNLVATVTKDGRTENLVAEFVNDYTYLEPGDESNIALWLIVMITALGAALFTANKPRRKQRDF